MPSTCFTPEFPPVPQLDAQQTRRGRRQGDRGGAQGQQDRAVHQVSRRKEDTRWYPGEIQGGYIIRHRAELSIVSTCLTSGISSVSQLVLQRPRCRSRQGAGGGAQGQHERAVHQVSRGEGDTSGVFGVDTGWIQLRIPPKGLDAHPLTANPPRALRSAACGPTASTKPPSRRSAQRGAAGTRPRWSSNNPRSPTRRATGGGATECSSLSWH